MFHRSHIIEANEVLNSDKLGVAKASYLDGYRLRIDFTDGKRNDIDFSNFILNNNKKYLSKYKDISRFKKFKIENGNLVWGKDWDIIFPIIDLYHGYVD